jgi:hypothetical protein
VASGVNGYDGNVDANDMMTITFWPKTNRANLPSSGISKAQIDAILRFSEHIGADYRGEWVDESTLRVTVVDPAGVNTTLRGVLRVSCVQVYMYVRVGDVCGC